MNLCFILCIFLASTSSVFHLVTYSSAFYHSYSNWSLVLVSHGAVLSWRPPWILCGDSLLIWLPKCRQADQWIHWDVDWWGTSAHLSPKRVKNDAAVSESDTAAGRRQTEGLFAEDWSPSTKWPRAFLFQDRIRRLWKVFLQGEASLHCNKE